MTNDPTNPGPAAGTASEPSGADLARIALNAAREAARKRGAETTAPRRRRKPSTQREPDGRDPKGLGAVLSGLMTERAWALPAAGGTILAQWPTIAASIAPQLPEHVQAVAFHPDTGQLDLRPDSPAYGTQLRLITQQIITAVNDSAGKDTIRTIRVLPVGHTSLGHTPDTPEPSAATPTAPSPPASSAKPEPSPGYRQALAAYQAARPAPRVDPALADAVARQTEALRELSQRAFPEPASNSGPTSITSGQDGRRRDTAAVRAQAIRRARAERTRTHTTPPATELHPARPDSGRPHAEPLAPGSGHPPGTRRTA